MSVIRIKKTKNYTLMCNNHFKEKEMSLKAKGLMSLMLSLPEDWDYTVSGLCKLSSDKETSVKNALKELEKFGYLKRKRTYENGKISGIEYTLFEEPFKEDLKVDFQLQENQLVENHGQLNTNKLNTNNINKKSTKKESSKDKYLSNCERIIEEYDFSEEVIAKILVYLKNRSKLNNDQLRIQLEILAKLNSIEQLSSLDKSIGAGYKMMAYPKEYSYSRNNKSDIPTTPQEDRDNFLENNNFRKSVIRHGGLDILKTSKKSF